MENAINLILEHLEKNESVMLETEDSILEIVLKPFFSDKKQFLFMLNSRAVDSCKTKKAGIKKISGWIEKGFILQEDNL